jgi:hypothetical protein
MKKLAVCLLILLNIPALQATKEITINITNRHKKFLADIEKFNPKIKCICCGKDLSDEDIDIVCCADYGRCALYMCSKCAKAFDKNYKETHPDTGE